MNLRFLGKGSAFYPVYGNTGAYMLYGKELYLLDCGETAFERLYELVGFDEIERVYVIRTPAVTFTRRPFRKMPPACMQSRWRSSMPGT